MGVEKIACPDSIQVADPKLVTPVKGWTAIADNAMHPLSGVTFYDGRPEEKPRIPNASQAPYRTTKDSQTWLLDAKAERGYWLACRYSGTSMTLARALPKGLTQCTVTYNSEEQVEGMPVIEGISCK